MPSKRRNKALQLAPPTEFLEAPVQLSQLELSLQSAPDLSRSPVRVGPYLLLERLGSGGMAEVYLARKDGVRGFEKDVAIKCVLPRHLADRNVNDWFEQEAKLGSRLNHANIAQIYDFTRTGDSYWLVMEYVHGRALEEILKKARNTPRAISVAVASYILFEMLKALEYAHNYSDDRSGERSPVIHRDITPKNVMLSYQGEVKIVDFGIAKSGPEENSKATQFGLVKGTPGYMSPEQIRAEPLDARTDLYSACVVLYELLAAKRLFPNRSVQGTSAKHDRAVSARLSALTVPAPIKKFLAKGLSWERSERFESAQEMRGLLEREFQNSSDFNQSAAAELLGSLFEKEMAEEKRAVEKREARIELWRSRGLSLPVVDGSFQETKSARWKRSPLILVLLVITVFTTFLNLYLQLDPTGMPFDRGFNWRYRSLATQQSCFISVDSLPRGAVVSANSVVLGKTPAKFRVKCGAELSIQLEQEGFLPLQTELLATEPSHQLLLHLSQKR